MQIPRSWVVAVSSAGYGLILSICLVGAVRIVGEFMGTSVSSATANSIFGISALILVPTMAYFRFASIFVRAPGSS
jgi:hypothetical protein